MTITFDQRGSVASIRISRPERRNALNHAALDQLGDALDRVTDRDARALVIHGDADHFCSGADLTELEDLSFTRTLRGVLDALCALPIPTIAAVSGACMGLGMQLAVSCDIRGATPDARFAVPVAKLGLMVDHWTLTRVASLAGTSTARWMVSTARPVTAERMYTVGFLHELVEPGPDGPGAAVEQWARELAEDVARLAPLTLAGSKMGLDLLATDPTDSEGRYEAAFERAWASDDLVEGRAAFAAGRRPEFRGR